MYTSINTCMHIYMCVYIDPDTDIDTDAGIAIAIDGDMDMYCCMGVVEDHLP